MRATKWNWCNFILLYAFVTKTVTIIEAAAIKFLMEETHTISTDLGAIEIYLIVDMI